MRERVSMSTRVGGRVGGRCRVRWRGGVDVGWVGCGMCGERGIAIGDGRSVEEV